MAQWSLSLSLLLKGFVCPGTKCEAHGNPARRLFQKEQAMEPRN